MKIKSICYVINIPYNNGSIRYRSFLFAEGLSYQNIFTKIVHTHELELFSENTISSYDLYIFVRPSKNQISLIERIRKHKKVVAEYDDLIFGRKDSIGCLSNFKHNITCEKAFYDFFNNNLETLMLFNAFIVSTEPLMREILKHKKNAGICLLSNGISLFDCDFIKYNHFFWRKKTNLIGYFSGTMSHCYDFLQIKDDFLRFLSDNREFSFKLMGPLTLPKEFEDILGNRLIRIPAGPFHDMLRELSTVDCAIAPLTDNRFNRCKSKCKFLETALVGSQLVASPIPDMVQVNSDRIHLVKDNDWYSAISKSLNCTPRYTQQELLNDYSVKNLSNKLLKFLSEL